MRTDEVQTAMKGNLKVRYYGRPCCERACKHAMHATQDTGSRKAFVVLCNCRSSALVAYAALAFEHVYVRVVHCVPYSYVVWDAAACTLVNLDQPSVSDHEPW